MNVVVPGLVGLSPVLAFLAALVWLDSYKLVSLRAVLVAVGLGFVAALAGYAINGVALNALDIEMATFARYVAPVVEETLKAAIVVALIRSDRVGFLVDAAIIGFAVGAGFAIVENLHYQRLAPEASLGTWIVRGFGTAIMHGGATAIFAMLGLGLLERGGRVRPWAILPGLALAVVLHSAFNHFFLSPKLSTLGIAVVVPLALYAVFQFSEKAVGNWLGKGFDADTEMLGLINSGRLSDSPVGRYLHTLKDRFEGPVVADVLCYLRLYTELALRAKGILIMRENGFEVP
ncbi:MAG TPA: PrsW family glutamic-type intramembrane protease, partial [Casimicrobiaceae bacterium]|nr:PrsW family glutamic-type intramembrane protease [Casimicrobiaceae bacterium]